MTMPSLNFMLGQEEVILIAILLKSPTIPGLGENPLNDLSPDQASIALQVAERSLKAKGFLQEPESGTLQVDPVVAMAIGVCTIPDISFLATSHLSSGEIEARYYHIHHESAVIIEHLSPELGLHSFNKLTNRQDITQEIIRLLHLDTQIVTTFETNRVRHSVIAQAKEKFVEGNHDVLVSFLQSGGLEPPQAQAFAQVMVTPISNGSVTRIDYQADRSGISKGFATLEGTETFWIMRPEGDEEDPLISLETPKPSMRIQLLQNLVERE